MREYAKFLSWPAEAERMPEIFCDFSGMGEILA
jgi:hypothetical protein